MAVPKLTCEERVENFQSKIMSRKNIYLTWTEVITEYCEDNSIDMEDIIDLISPMLKNKLWIEANSLNNIISEYRENAKVEI